ncbi:MFS transporter [Rothia sp. HC945]|jgi:MFS family permease|uniref:MFS transporter n=1 Tax=Rothia sp. HC945 TaxID=3171170 RepID=UPI00264C3874|nr:MFS transporter [Kocuria sp.]
MARLLMDLSPLKKYPDFRRLWMGSAFSTLGFQVTSMAVSLQIFHITGSTFAVGSVGLVAVLPLIIGGLYGGVIADARDRRLVALTVSVILWLVSVLIALQAFLHLENVWVLYGLIAVQSFVHPINQSARGAIIPKVVGLKRLPAANALNMSVNTLATTLGPMLGGFLVAAVGYGWTYAVDVVTFTVGLWALYRLPAQVPEHDGTAPARGMKAVIDGFGFVRRSPVISMTFVLDLCAMVFLFPQALFPAMAITVVGGNAAVAGLLSGTMTLGAFLGTLLSGRAVSVTRQGAALTWTYAGWTIGMLWSGVSIAWIAVGTTPGTPTAWVGLALCMVGLMVAGASDAVGGIYRSTILQTAAPDTMRGRLQGLFIVTVTGGPRIGSGVMGAAGQWAGPGMALVYGAVACAASVGALSAKFPQLRAYHAPVPPETSAMDTLQTPQARTETAEIPQVPPPPAQHPEED